MEKVKQFFILIMLGAAFIWSIYTMYVFWGYVEQWSSMAMTSRLFISQIIFFVLKNIPTVIAVAIARSKW
jgi:hypothetical protein